MIDVSQLVKQLPTVAESAPKGKVTRETQQTREAELIATKPGTLAAQVVGEEQLPDDTTLHRQLQPVVATALVGFKPNEMVYGLLLLTMACRALHRSRKTEFSAPRELGSTDAIEWRREVRVFPYGKTGYVAAMRGCGLVSNVGGVEKPDYERADEIATGLVNAGLLAGRGRSGYLLAGIVEPKAGQQTRAKGVKKAPPTIQASASTWELFVKPQTAGAGHKQTTEEAIAAADKAAEDRKASEASVSVDEAIRQAALAMIASGQIAAPTATAGADAKPAKRGKK